MGHIEIIKAGALSSVQDSGRMRHIHAGVPRSGAFDTVALRTGNRILGNPETDAAIEMTLVGAEICFMCPAVISLSGAQAADAVMIRNQQRIALPMHTPVVLAKGDRIDVGRISNGARVYLCVKGGVQTPEILGSRSALVSLPDAGLGRALRAGERLPMNEHAVRDEHITQSTPSLIRSMSLPRILRVVAGAHTERFTSTQQQSFATMDFTIADQSNRAGVRLVGAAIPGPIPERMQSEGTLPGYVQVPPSGEPIVLGVDGPTTGGYPVIACVIEADLPVLAQCALRDPVRFVWVTHEAAQEAWMQQHAMVQQHGTPGALKAPKGSSDV